MPKCVQKFAKYKINNSKISPKTFIFFAKVAKFRRIWSHWLRLASDPKVSISSRVRFLTKNLQSTKMNFVVLRKPEKLN